MFLATVPLKCDNSYPNKQDIKVINVCVVLKREFGWIAIHILQRGCFIAPDKMTAILQHYFLFKMFWHPINDLGYCVQTESLSRYPPPPILQVLWRTRDHCNGVLEWGKKSDFEMLWLKRNEHQNLPCVRTGGSRIFIPSEVWASAESEAAK